MKKRLIVLSGVFMLGLAACGSSTENQTENATKESEKSKTESQGEDEVSVQEGSTTEYSIAINGVEYDFPMSYEEFAALGWKNYYDETGSKETEDGLDASYTKGGMFYNNGDIVGLEFIYQNSSDTYQTYENCMVVGVSVNYEQTLNGQDDAEDVVIIPDGSIVINNKLSIGESTREDVHNLLGADWSEETWENVDYKTLSPMLYYMTDEESVHNMLTMSFDDNDIFREFKYLKADK